MLLSWVASDTRIKKQDIRYMSVYSDVELLVPVLRRCTNLERLRFTLHRMDHRDQELPELGSVLRLKYLGLLKSSFSFNNEVATAILLSAANLKFWKQISKMVSFDRISISGLPRQHPEECGDHRGVDADRILCADLKLLSAPGNTQMLSSPVLGVF